MSPRWVSFLALAVLGSTPRHSRAVRTYQVRDLLYLGSTNGKDTIRVGLDARWGGAIVLLSYQGQQIVNRSDAGREVQLALYDGDQAYDVCPTCSGVSGWNPTQAGDHYGHGSPIVADSVAPDHLYTKTLPIEWYPDNKGGGAAHPIPTDVIMEQWVSVSPSDWRVIQVHYRVTYTGHIERGNGLQELPAVYVNREYDRFVYYHGDAPWTNAPLVDTALPIPAPVPVLHMPEKWAALVNPEGLGLTVYTPQQYPYGGGRRIFGAGRPADWSTVYYRPLVYYSMIPGRVLSGDYVLIPGDYRVARQLVAGLRNRMKTADMVTPFGFVDAPKTGTTLSGTVSVTGWAIDNAAVAQVEVYVDGKPVGVAQYGTPRPDLQPPYVGAQLNAGYRYLLDTRSLTNGEHAIRVRVTDSSGNVALFKRVTIIVRN